MEDGKFEHSFDENGREKVKISKVPLEDLLNILENLYEQGVNYIDFDFLIDPQEIQSVISISTRPEYISTPEELEEEKLLAKELEDDEEDEDEDEEDDVLQRIKREQEKLSQEAPDEALSDDDLNELI